MLLKQQLQGQRCKYFVQNASNNPAMHECTNESVAESHTKVDEYGMLMRSELPLQNLVVDGIAVEEIIRLVVAGRVVVHPVLMNE